MKKPTNYEAILEICRDSNIAYSQGDCRLSAAGADFVFSPTGQLLDVEQDENLIEELKGEVQTLEQELLEEKGERQAAEQALLDYKKKVAQVLGAIKDLESLSKPD